jgi:hypothetical protein
MATKRHLRKRTQPNVETAVLAKSARRCALCFHLSGDLTEKNGQIAHLDGDRTNGAEDNLAWMCMDHHSLFDSKTSQHKNYTIREVKHARSKLYKLVADCRHLAARNALPREQSDLPNIRVEILDAYFPSEAAAKLNPGASEDTYLFVRCRLANTANQSTTIRRWGLTVRVPKDGVSLSSIDAATDVKFDIYTAQLLHLSNFVVRRRVLRPFETGSKSEVIRETLRDIRNEKLVLSRGVGEEGWIAGVFVARVREDFKNGLIYLAVMDEFDQSFSGNFMVVFAPTATYSIERAE